MNNYIDKIMAIAARMFLGSASLLIIGAVIFTLGAIGSWLYTIVGASVLKASGVVVISAIVVYSIGWAIEKFMDLL